MKLTSLLLVALLISRPAFGALDFFALPDKIVVPKSVAATPAPSTPAPATPNPKPPEPTREIPGVAEPSLIADGMYLKTPAISGTQAAQGGRFYDLGQDKGILIGFQYTTGQNEDGGTVIESLTPLFLRSKGKLTGITRGNRAADQPGTMMEARPGYAVGRVAVRAAGSVDYLRVTFMRYENGVLDPRDSYIASGVGNREANDDDTTGELRTDRRPFIGIYGRAGSALHELGLLVRREAGESTSPAGLPTPRPDNEWATHLTPPPRAATPAPTPSGGPAPAGAVQVFACGSDKYTLFLNGREILAGSDSSNVESGSFAVVKGDVVAAVARDTGSGDLWFSLRVVRDGTTVLDAGDMLYQTTEPPTWKTSRLMSGFSTPKISTHRSKSMGSDSRPRLVRPGPKDTTASALFLKGVVP